MIISCNNMCMIKRFSQDQIKKKKQVAKQKPARVKLSYFFAQCRNDDNEIKKLIKENSRNKKELQEVKKRILELNNDKTILKSLFYCCVFCGIPILYFTN